jgi:transcriptional regulator with XRE-family HTH domain
VPFAQVDVRGRLALNVKLLRGKMGISQEELADRVGVHRTYVSDIERIKRNPSITVVEQFAKALGVRIGELVD